MGFELIAEQKIREANEQGKFSGLAGEGKPLREVDDKYSGENWLAMHMLHQNGFLPEWLELRKQVHDDRDAVNAAMTEWAEALERYGSMQHAIVKRAGENYRRKAVSINAKIDLHNLRCPSFDLELARFREDAVPAGH